MYAFDKRSDYLAAPKEECREEPKEAMPYIKGEEESDDLAKIFGFSPEESFASEPPIQGKGFRDKRPLAQQIGGNFRSSGKKLKLPGELSENIENSFGLDPNKISFRESSDVAKMGAKATAQGNVVSFALGEFNPDTKEGRKVLGHELNHVREQAQGKIKANVEGTNIHFDPSNEAASDRAGDAFAGGTMSGAEPVSVPTGKASAAVQRLSDEEKLRLPNIPVTTTSPAAIATSPNNAVAESTGGENGGKATAAKPGLGTRLLNRKRDVAVPWAKDVAAPAVGNGLLAAGNSFFRNGIDRASDTVFGGIGGGIAGGVNAVRNGENVIDGITGGARSGRARAAELREISENNKNGEYSGLRGWLPHRADWLPDETDLSAIPDFRKSLAVSSEVSLSAHIAREQNLDSQAKSYQAVKDRAAAAGRSTTQQDKFEKHQAHEKHQQQLRDRGETNQNVKDRAKENGRSIRKQKNFEKNQVHRGIIDKQMQDAEAKADTEKPKNRKERREHKQRRTQNKRAADMKKLQDKHPKLFDRVKKLGGRAKKLGGRAKKIGKVGTAINVARGIHSVGTAFARGGVWGDGEDSGAVQEATTQAGKIGGTIVGGKAGAKVGAKIGGAIGTLIPIPVVGTAIGAALGGLAGGFIGSRLGARAGQNAGEKGGGWLRRRFGGKNN